jgi:hypothetical protein
MRLLPCESIKETNTMNFPKSTLAVTALFALACTGAYASGSGEVTKEGKTTKLTNAYAYRRADHFDDKKMLTVVVFSTKPADTVKVNAAGDAIRELTSQLSQQDATYVEMEIAADGSVEQLGVHSPELSESGSTGEKPTLTHNDDKRIEGTFLSKNEKDKASKFGAYYDLKFALDIPATTPAKH